MALPQQYQQFGIEKELYTEDEYFAFEATAFGRWEFIPSKVKGLGEIRQMAGGTPNHSGIAMNLGAALANALRGAGNRTCRVFGSDLKVHTGDGRNMFPDVSVACGTLNPYQRRKDVIANPLLVAEVLSRSTQGDDRGAKWESYQTVPTLQYYLLLASDKARVELFTREAEGWRYTVFDGEEASFSLPSLNVTLILADLYALVEFEDGD